MTILKEILANEVFPALGCTEPIACADATAAAAEQLTPSPVRKITLVVDPGTYKNGAAVTVPHSGGAKGNLIAAAMGAFVADASPKLEVLKKVTPDILHKATALIEGGHIEYRCREDQRAFSVEAWVESADSRARCVLSGGHTNITTLEKDGREVRPGKGPGEMHEQPYRSRLKEMPLKDLITEVVQLDQETRQYLQQGVEMNLAIAEAGEKTRGTASQLRQMKEAGVMAEDLFYNIKRKVAGAVDARMSGYPMPMMTSGGSGNQGAVGILTPYLAGRHQGIDVDRILESIAVTHALNAYIKCFIGELSAVCGCSVAAGIGAASAIVYQRCGIDMQRITFAMDNVIGDLSGLICDGAKPGCAMKTVTAVDTALRSGFMAIDGFGLSEDDGILGMTPEDSIRNLSRISLEGMFNVDPTVIHILQDKATAHGRA